MAEQDDGDLCGDSSRDSYNHLREDEKKSSRRDSSTSGHNTYTIQSSSDLHNVAKSDTLLLKLDERQRLARERREEKEKQMAARESQLQEREERARLYYERQIEERRRRLEEQRLKEDKRRAAVEEKRRLKLQEDKVRYEAVIRRTQEKSQRARPKSNRWSWGGTLTTSTSHNSDPERRSVSTMNLSKHTDPVLTKRLSSSSATLLNSPDRGLRRMPLTPWENTIVSRLQTPTHSYLARSRSAMSLTGDSGRLCCMSSCHPMSTVSLKSGQSRSVERPVKASHGLERPIRAGFLQDGTTRRKTTGNVPLDRKEKDYVRKSWTNLSTPTLTPTNARRPPSPAGQRGKLSQSSPGRSATNTVQKTPKSRRSWSPPPPASLPLSRSIPSLSPGNLRPTRGAPGSQRIIPEGDKDQKRKEAKVQDEEAGMETENVKKLNEVAQEEKVASSESPVKAAADSSTPKEEHVNERTAATSSPATRPSAGTTDPEEATRLLAEKRRQAREQREREEEERRQQEVAEKRHREEMARRKAEEKAKREEEAQRLAEERKRKVEEEEKRLAEEKLQEEREEAERLQRQKEEEEARQREEAERLRQEREKHFQKQEAERLERKKRLEEIMKRTRRSDQKNSGQRNGEMSQQESQESVNSDPGIPSITVSAPPLSPEASHSESNGFSNSSISSDTMPPAEQCVSTEAELKENGVVMETQAFEEVIEVPMVTKMSRTEGDGEEDDETRKPPLLAFTENGGSLNLSLLENSKVEQETNFEV